MTPTPFIATEHVQVVSIKGQEILRVDPAGGVFYNYSHINREQTLRLSVALMVVLRDANLIDDAAAGGVIARLQIEMGSANQAWGDNLDIQAKIEHPPVPAESECPY